MVVFGGGVSQGCDGSGTAVDYAPSPRRLLLPPLWEIQFSSQRGWDTEHEYRVSVVLVLDH